ncbi:ANTAR domain-containing response regulator [Paenibacillus kobensis]|uniref:ANTAR domain-containing response regulator n=1 Tax=Paenibacillus kobensis TaxID=59841 RepID=UPI000FD6E413|nr:ANTAR domain-containing protein [Paenibacillus kobensis]
MKTILLIDADGNSGLAALLKESGRTVHSVRTEKEASSLISVADAVVMAVPYQGMLNWQTELTAMRKTPLFWYCTEQQLPQQLDWGFSLDGVLFPSMTAAELKHAFQWGQRVHQQRKRWSDERDQLLHRIEERKWIDQAKAVLCEIRGINEAEAYDFLRKQAMNERKRIGDVAASIVKVYQLIHG